MGGRLAFGALLAFTIILIGAPQERFAVLAPLRIALVSAGAAVLGYWLERWTFARPEAPTPREWIWAGALLGWAVATVPLSYWPSGSVATIVDIFLKSLLVFWLLGVVVNTPVRVRTVARTLTLLTLPLSLTALEHLMAGGGERIRGYRSGIAGNPNDLALTLTLLMPLAIALALAGRGRVWRLVGAGAAVLAAGGVIATFSRGGFIALTTTTLLYMLTWLRRGRVALVGTILFAALLGAALLPGGYLERLSTISEIESDPTGSAQARWRDMAAAADAIAASPIVGAGIGQDILALNEVRGDAWISVHNVYLQYAVDLGLPGLVLFCGLMGAAVMGTARAERRFARQTWLAPGERVQMIEFARALRISLLTFAIAALFHPVAYYFYFFYLAGLAVAVGRIAHGPSSRNTP
jgi:O-antigen ligase